MIISISHQAIAGQVAILASEDIHQNISKINTLLNLMSQYESDGSISLFLNSVKGIDYKSFMVVDADELSDTAKIYIDRVHVAAVKGITKVLAQESHIRTRGPDAFDPIMQDKLNDQKAIFVQQLIDTGSQVMNKKMTVSFGSKSKMMAAIKSFSDDEEINSVSDIRQESGHFADNPFTLIIWYPEEKKHELLHLLSHELEPDADDDYQPGIKSIEYITPMIPGCKDEVDLMRICDTKRRFDLGPSF